MTNSKEPTVSDDAETTMWREVAATRLKLAERLKAEKGQLRAEIERLRADVAGHGEALIEAWNSGFNEANEADL